MTLFQILIIATNTFRYKVGSKVVWKIFQFLVHQWIGAFLFLMTISRLYMFGLMLYLGKVLVFTLICVLSLITCWWSYKYASCMPSSLLLLIDCKSWRVSITLFLPVFCLTEFYLLLTSYISALSAENEQPDLQTAVSSGWPASLHLIGKVWLPFLLLMFFFIYKLYQTFALFPKWN